MKHLRKSLLTCALAAVAAGATAQYTVVNLFSVGYSSSEGYGVFGGQFVGVGTASGSQRAILWPGGPPVELHPSGGYNYSIASGAAAEQQVGYVNGSVTGSSDHAALWSGTAASFIDLHPAGYVNSRADDVDAGVQVGHVFHAVDSSVHAAQWFGSAASFVDLHPFGYDGSFAKGVDRGQVVGYAFGGTMNNFGHAMLWPSGPGSEVNLHPTGFTSSNGLGIGDGQQVGTGRLSGTDHALLWRGSAQSVVDLHPVSSYTMSTATATDGGQQVGYGTSSSTRALLWSGAAFTYVSLHNFLPVAYTDSYAYGIDARSGAIVGRAFNSSVPRWEAVVWMPTLSDKVRMLWKEPEGSSSGRAQHWRIDGPGVPVTTSYGSFPGWTARRLAVGSDNASRILWEHTNGRISFWTTLVNQTGFINREFGPFPGWRAHDMVVDDQNVPHLLWRRTDGQISLWTMRHDGVTITREYGPFPGWTAHSLAVGPDHRLRVLWRHTSGQVSLWTTNGEAPGFSNQDYGPYPGWTAQDLAVGQDNKPWLLWRHTSGQASLWTINSPGNFTSQDYGPFNGWAPQQVEVGRDSKARMMWVNSVNGQAASVWTINSPGNYTQETHQANLSQNWRAHSIALIAP